MLRERVALGDSTATGYYNDVAPFSLVSALGNWGFGVAQSCGVSKSSH
jgi:hypothetical protein